MATVAASLDCENLRGGAGLETGGESSKAIAIVLDLDLDLEQANALLQIL